MKNFLRSCCFIVALVIAVAMLVPIRLALADGFSGHSPASPEPPQAQAMTSDLAPGSAQLITPEDLVKILQSPKGVKPLILNVGPYLLYVQAHIPGSEYIGAGSDPQGIESLRRRVKALPHNKFIVLYCGCCPWEHCPTVSPAYEALHSMGFSKIRVLYIPNNFGRDWIEKGYPVEKGQ